METNSEQIKNYIRKLQRAINSSATFSFFNKKIIKKKIIDDILVCIIALLPEDYKTFIRMKEFSKLNSVKYYIALTQAIQNKFVLSNEYYLVYSDKALTISNMFIKTINTDLKAIYNSK